MGNIASSNNIVRISFYVPLPPATKQQIKQNGNYTNKESWFRTGANMLYDCKI